MKKQPIDMLTPQDIYNISKYIYMYADESNVEYGGIKKVLSYWNKNKKRLFHAFGNKLTVKKQIEIESNYKNRLELLRTIYHYYKVEDQRQKKAFIDAYEETSNMIMKGNFIDKVFYFILKNEKLTDAEKYKLLKLFEYNNVLYSHIGEDFSDGLKLSEYNFTVKSGMKTIRTIQKMLKALKYPDIKEFDKWRNEINSVIASKKTKVTLVLSIHPIDFMTMSDNNSNWRSCMSWINRGCYSAGTIEMMNSNIAAVAYLEGNHPFEIALDDIQKISVPNKTWRSLVFIHKDIIVSGKPYPYDSDKLSKEVVNFARELVEKNFHWNYQFINQRYQDLATYNGSNYFLKYNCLPNYQPNQRKIIFYSNGMYHDMIEDKTNMSYWCCRNDTKKGLKINISGPVTCMCCGEPMYDTYEIYKSDDIDDEKICEECHSLKKKCSICGKIMYKPFYNIDENNCFCSEECIKEGYYFPGQKIVISKEEFLNNKRKKIPVIFCREESIQKTVRQRLYGKLFKFLTKDNVLSFIKKELLKDNLICGKDYTLFFLEEVLIYKVLMVNYRWRWSKARIFFGDELHLNERTYIFNYNSDFDIFNMIQTTIKKSAYEYYKSRKEVI